MEFKKPLGLLFYSLCAIFFLFPMAKSFGNIGSAMLLLFGIIFFLKDFSFNVVYKTNLLIGLPFFILFILASIGVFYGESGWSDKIDYSLKSLRYLAIFFGAYLIFRLNCANFVLRSFSISMVFTLLMVYLSVIFVLPWAPQVPPAFEGDHTIWGDYITQNIMISFFAVWMLHQGLEVRNYKKRFVYGALFLLSMIAVLTLSYGRTGYVMAFGAFMGYGFFRFSDWRLRVAVFLLCIFAIIVLYFSVDVFRERLNLGYAEFMNADGKESLTSIGARILMWKTAWSIGWSSPWWGVGSGSYALEWCARMGDQDWCDVGQHPHNHFLLLFASNGIFAFLAYLSIFLGAIFVVIKKYTDEYFLLIIFLIILLIDSMLNGPFWNIREANFFTLMGALVLAKVLEKIAILHKSAPAGVVA